jgi:adenylate cyclase
MKPFTNFDYNPARAFLPLAGFLIALSFQALAQTQPLSYWESQLNRQTDSVRKADMLLLVAKDYETANPAAALGYAERSLAIGEVHKLPKVIGLAATQLSRLHTALGNNGKARRYRKQAEKALANLDLVGELTKLEADKQKAEEKAEATERAQQEILSTSQEVLETQQQQLATSRQQLNALSSEAQQKTRDLALRQQQVAQQTYLMSQKDSLLSRKDVEIILRDSMLTKRELVLRLQTDQIKLLEQERALQTAKAEQERLVKNASLVGAGLFLVIAVLLWRVFRVRQKGYVALAKKNAELDIARRRSDELLENILPAELIDELKTTGITQTRHHDEVTIMFTDFKDFTKISEQLTPEELVGEIDFCFRRFDEIISKYPSIEKIKTIGDAYLCAGGLPDPSHNHATEVVSAALEIRDFIGQLQAQRAKEGRIGFQVRIGVHSGPVVAGVVGSTKFAYDIWGDTVNTAARLESVSEPGRVNISEATYQQIHKQFACYHRGLIASKNKTEMSMYFVEPGIVEVQAC